MPPRYFEVTERNQLTHLLPYLGLVINHRFTRYGLASEGSVVRDHSVEISPLVSHVGE